LLPTEIRSYYDPGHIRVERRLREEELAYVSDDASLLRVARRDHEKARRVPAELRAELSRAGSLGLGAWLEARARKDFGILLPHLERQLELKRRYVACFDPAEDDYDLLLDDFEPGLSTAEAESVLEELKDELVPLVAAVSELDSADDVARGGPFDVEVQKRFSVELLRGLGFDPGAWRLDPVERSFAMAASLRAIRIPT